MTFAIFPPEINSGLMYSGVGSGPLVAAASAWDGLAADLSSTAAAYQSVVANLTTGPWLGGSSAAFAAASAPYVTWLNTTAEQAAQVGTQAKAAAAAYETAFAGTVPPPVIAANRSLQAALIATNFFGQNTAAIAMTELHYLEMWFQDAFSMDNYAVANQQAMALPQHTPPPPVASSDGAQQVAAAAQATASPAAGLGSLFTDLFSLLQVLFSGTTATVAPDLTTVLGDLGITGATASSIVSGLTAGGSTASTASLLPLQAAYYALMAASMPARMLMSLGMGARGAAGALGATGLMGGSETLMSNIGQFIDGKMQLVVGSVSNQLRTWGSTVSAQLASAHSLGGLSVPHAWSAAASPITRAAPILPNTAVSAPAATASTGLPGGPFGNALMGALSGRGLSSLAAKAPKVVPRSPAGG